jgi:hypothetical protein
MERRASPPVQGESGWRVPNPNVVLFDVRVGFHSHVPRGPLFDASICTRGGVARPIAKRRAGMFSRRCQFSKGGMLTFAYRSKFFANSYFRASRPTFFITHFLYSHHRHRIPIAQ